MKPLRLVLCFHLNQTLLPYAYIASRACYRGLLAVLRRHPGLPITLHLSGTLIHALRWLDPPVLHYVEAGLAAGQFELLGSTYAQNVPYASEDADNRVQAALHRELLQRTWGVAPNGFWNSERCWRSSLAPFITEAGYRYTLVEDGFLKATGAVPGRVHEIEGLRLLSDDQQLKHRFNMAMWTGRRRPLLEYLESLHEQQGEESWVVSYAEDGEACGLWGYERGLLPQAHWALLDQLLGEFEQIPWLQVILPQTALAEEAVLLAALPDGQASWMVDSLRTPGAPYHEDGYADWFDFQSRSPHLIRMRGVYDHIRRRLQQVEEKAHSPAARRLVKLAWRTYAAHQFEFGCIGVGGKSGVGWDGVHQAVVLARAAEEADQANPHARRWSEDVNEDGQEELLLADGHTLAVFSPRGGRLLYAFDLSAGQCWVGNPGQEPDWGFPWDEHACPRRADDPRPWLPPSDEPDLAPFAHMAARGDSRRLLRHLLPDELLERIPPETLLPQRPSDGRPGPGPLPASRRALNESLWVDGALVLASGELGEAGWAGAGPVLVTGDRYGSLAVEKRVTLDRGALSVTYRLQNRGPRPLQVVLEVEDELCPDALTLLDGGKEELAAVALAPVPPARNRAQPDREQGAGQTILNRISGAAVHLQSRPVPVEIATELVIGALVMRRSFRLAIGAGEEKVIQLGLRAESGAGAGA